jgi:hypothetical protein
MIVPAWKMGRRLAGIVFATALAALAQPPSVSNLSVRALVGTGQDVLIAGFHLGPGADQTMLIRATGPALAGFGVTGVLADPKLEVFAGATKIGENDNWSTPVGGATAVTPADFTATGAFGLAMGSRDAAFIGRFPPGSYSAKVSGVNTTTGVALVEVYKVGAGGPGPNNLSARAQVGVGADVLIPGLVISPGSGTRRLLIRAAGPALGALGVVGALADPTLRVVGAAGAVVATNDHWGTPVGPLAFAAPALSSAFSQSGAFAFAPGSRDAALIAEFPPGNYTVQVSGAGNTRGVAVVEVYDVSPAAVTSTSVDASSLTGKVMCGYQGWFNGEGDGANRGYNHWAPGGRRPGPGRVNVDLWPDLTDYGANERFPTDFVHADGRPAEVFSSYLRPTAMRHFQWMREHGIDGVFVQRFINSLRNANSLRHNDTVLAHCREGARVHGRAYALMYDLSGLAPGQADFLIADWRRLVRETALTRDAAYLHHRGKPLLALWGCGFLDDSTRPTLDDWRKILAFLKDDPDAGGLSLMLGVPSFWRTQTRDAIPDPALHEVLQLADVISPWSVGRYRTPAEAASHATTVWQPDLLWCRARGIDFLPVAFPGFSWSNLKGAGTPLDQIPRLQGRFLWSQVTAAKLTGADMLYVAMFDEVDEATAIFKCTDQPPVGTGVSFLTYEGLPSDHYLHLTGLATQVIRGDRAVTTEPPGR